MQESFRFHSREEVDTFLTELTALYPDNQNIRRGQEHHTDVKWGLRNADGTGVITGLTQVGSVQGYYIEDGEKIPMPGKLYYRGISVEDLIQGFVSENRFGFEEDRLPAAAGPAAQPGGAGKVHPAALPAAAPARHVHRGHDPEGPLPERDEQDRPERARPLFL